MSIQLLEEFTNEFYKIYRVESGVFAVITNIDFKAYAGSNSLIVDIGGRTVIFDTMLYLKSAKMLFQDAKKLTNNSKVIVVNSHWHWDHIRGNQEFETDQSLYITTDGTRNKMVDRNEKDIERDKVEMHKTIEYIRSRLDTENDDIQTTNSLQKYLKLFTELREELWDIDITLPSITFDSMLTFHGNKRKVKLITFGGAHTVSDVILYLPEERILHAGDLITNAKGYYLDDGMPDNWLYILDKIENLNPILIIPGHGDLGGQELLIKAKDYFVKLEKYIQHVIDRSLSDDDILSLNIEDQDFLKQYPDFRENIIIYKDYLSKA